MIGALEQPNASSSRIDFVAYAKGEECKDSARQTGEKLFALTVIDCSTADYLYFGLEEEGQHVPENFWSAVEFFFRIRSWDKETWCDSPPVEDMVSDPDTGKRSRRVIIPSPETLKLQCFDRYFEVAELDKHITIEAFLDNLKQRRINLLLENRTQVRKNIEMIRKRFMTKSGQLGLLQPQLENFPEHFMDVLVHPTEPKQLEDLLYPDIILPIKRRYHTRFGIRHGRPAEFSMVLKPLITKCKGQREFNLCEQPNN